MGKPSGKCRIPTASGDRDGGKGFKKMGKFSVVESPAASSPPPFSQGSKKSGPKYHGGK